MNPSVGPDELVEPLLAPAVDRPDLNRTDRPVESGRFEVEEDDIWLLVPGVTHSASLRTPRFDFFGEFYQI